MLTDESVAVIERFWAADHGCTVEELRRDEIVATPHGRGIFIFSRRGAVVALPPSLAVERVVGPAFIGYADGATFVGGDEAGARALGDADGDAVAALRDACEPVAWEQGGPSPATATAVGVFRGGALAALASYELWGDRIAHIGIITHPAHRGRGLGKAAVCAMSRIALARGLVAQYRTLCANTPSMAIARALGFQRYATTLSIRGPFTSDAS
jgi:ribosomal protein S18 acetylase RimI-like enzyme